MNLILDDEPDESPKDDGGIPIEIKEQQNIGSVAHGHK